MVNCIRFSRTAPGVFYATEEIKDSVNGVLECWDARHSRKPVFSVIQTTGTVVASRVSSWCCPHPQRSEIVASVCGNALYIWDLRRLSSPLFQQQSNDVLKCCEFSVDGTNIVTGGSENVSRWTFPDSTQPWDVIGSSQITQSTIRNVPHYYEGLSATNEEQVCSLNYKL